MERTMVGVMDTTTVPGWGPAMVMGLDIMVATNGLVTLLLPVGNPVGVVIPI